MMTQQCKEIRQPSVGRIDEGGPIDIESGLDQGFFSRAARDRRTIAKGVRINSFVKRSILQEKFSEEAWR